MTQAYEFEVKLIAEILRCFFPKGIYAAFNDRAAHAAIPCAIPPFTGNRLKFDRGTQVRLPPLSPRVGMARKMPLSLARPSFRDCRPGSLVAESLASRGMRREICEPDFRFGEFTKPLLSIFANSGKRSRNVGCLGKSSIKSRNLAALLAVRSCADLVEIDRRISARAI